MDTVPGTGIVFELRDSYPTDQTVIKEIFTENVYETHGWHFDEQGDVIDIGANIGAFAIYAASIGAKKVYAIEPEPHNLNALINNISLNGLEEKISVCDIAISNYNGKAIINDLGGDSTIVDSDLTGSEINVSTLDKFFKQNKIVKVDVLKIDVEGSEPEIILSASKKTIDKCKYIAIEFDIRTGSKLGEMVMKLSETHHVRTMGSWERGGMIFANRY